jgi:hypothetical protein
MMVLFAGPPAHMCGASRQLFSLGEKTLAGSCGAYNQPAFEVLRMLLLQHS